VKAFLLCNYSGALKFVSFEKKKPTTRLERTQLACKGVHRMPKNFDINQA
jgi:hypothetical protein